MAARRASSRMAGGGHVVGRLLVAALVAGGFVLAIRGPAEAATTTSLRQEYDIAATLDVATATLDALETLTVTNLAPRTIDHLNLSVIPRALGYLAMDQPITVNGIEAASSWTTSTNLRVELIEPLDRGQSAELKIPFRLTVGASAPPFSARLSVHNGVLSFGQWFPIVSTEHDVYGLGDPQISFTADRIRLRLTTTQPLPRDSVACAGLVAAPETTGTDWVCEVEQVRDFSFAVNPAFHLTPRDVNGIALRVYTQTVSGEVTADLAGTALAGMEEAFGEYPWPDLVIAEVGTGDGFSMEYPRSIHLTRSKVTDTYVIYHEVAHQWFYAQLGNDQQREPWLDEGFADYSARMLMGIGEDHCSTRPVDSTVFDWQAGAISGGDWTSCDGYFHAVFYQGTAFLNRVRSAMGDEAFSAAIRSFLERYRHRVVTDRILLGHLQRQTDADLLPLFRTYLGSFQPAGGPGPRTGGGALPR